MEDVDDDEEVNITNPSQELWVPQIPLRGADDDLDVVEGYTSGDIVSGNGNVQSIASPKSFQTALNLNEDIGKCLNIEQFLMRRKL